MAATIGLRDDCDSGALRAAANRSKDGPQPRRLLALKPKAQLRISSRAPGRDQSREGAAPDPIEVWFADGPR